MYVICDAEYHTNVPANTQCISQRDHMTTLNFLVLKYYFKVAGYCSINHHHYTARACLVHTHTKQTGMKSLMRVFCSCCAVGNDHQRGYPSHHDRKAAMIKSTCIHQVRATAQAVHV